MTWCSKSHISKTAHTFTFIIHSKSLAEYRILLLVISCFIRVIREYIGFINKLLLGEANLSHRMAFLASNSLNEATLSSYLFYIVRHKVTSKVTSLDIKINIRWVGARWRFCVVTLIFGFFSGGRGSCHRSKSDFFFFLFFSLS